MLLYWRAMSSSEKWNGFQENIRSAFGYLRKEKEFTNVTIACEEGQEDEAHKVILAASSPFFQNLLIRTRHDHPLIYVRGMKSHDHGFHVLWRGQYISRQS